MRWDLLQLTSLQGQCIKVCTVSRLMRRRMEGYCLADVDMYSDVGDWRGTVTYMLHPCHACI